MKKKAVPGIHIVKRRGHREKFDEKKVYGSVYAACSSAQFPEQECERVASSVTRQIAGWIKSRKAVSSDLLFREIWKALEKRSKAAAFMYKTHKDLS